MEGVPLHFEPDALRAIAREAIKKGTGARSLRSIVDKLLTPAMFEVPSLVRSGKPVAGVLVTRDAVRRERRARVVEGPEEWEALVPGAGREDSKGGAMEGGEEEGRERATV